MIIDNQSKNNNKNILPKSSPSRLKGQVYAL